MIPRAITSRSFCDHAGVCDVTLRAGRISQCLPGGSTDSPEPNAQVPKPATWKYHPAAFGDGPIESVARMSCIRQGDGLNDSSRVAGDGLGLSWFEQRRIRRHTIPLWTSQHVGFSTKNAGGVCFRSSRRDLRRRLMVTDARLHHRQAFWSHLDTFIDPIRTARRCFVYRTVRNAKGGRRRVRPDSPQPLGVGSQWRSQISKDGRPESSRRQAGTYIFWNDWKAGR